MESILLVTIVAKLAGIALLLGYAVIWAVIFNSSLPMMTVAVKVWLVECYGWAMILPAIVFLKAAKTPLASGDVFPEMMVEGAITTLIVTTILVGVLLSRKRIMSALRAPA